MDPFAAFDTLAIVVEFGVASVGVSLAVVLATLLAWYLAPFSPSDALGEVYSLTTRESDVYIATQWRLHESRKARRALMHDSSTRRLRNDATISDLSLAQSFAALPVRTVAVSVRPLPMMVVA